MGELFIIFPCCILTCYAPPPGQFRSLLPPLSLSGQFIIFSLFLFFSSFFLFFSFSLQNIRMGSLALTLVHIKMDLGGNQIILLVGNMPIF